jgi:hypothetical protein
MNRKTYAVLQSIMRAGVFEDRLEYDVEDLARSNDLMLVEATDLHNRLHDPDFLKHWHGINQKFLETLYTGYGTVGTFTSKIAEDLYVRNHYYGWKGVKTKTLAMSRNDTDTGWGRMSARNTLYRAVRLGILRKPSRGIYYFPG